MGSQAEAGGRSFVPETHATGAEGKEKLPDAGRWRGCGRGMALLRQVETIEQ